MMAQRSTSATARLRQRQLDTRSADYRLEAFMSRSATLTGNRHHLLHPLLPSQREQHYSLRDRSHNL